MKTRLRSKFQTRPLRSESEEDVTLERGREGEAAKQEKQKEKDDQILNWQCLPCSPLVTTRLLARRVGHNPRT